MSRALTAEQLCAAMGATPERAARWLAPIAHACAVFAINTPARQAAFLAQLGHESGRGRYTREIWGPTPAQQRYEGRKDLGNVQTGDGRRYLGRGLIQTTGRANYAATRDGLRRRMAGVPDFEASPESLELPQWAALSAAWYWDSRALNALADQETDAAFLSITKKINGGTNGLADRRALWDAARRSLSDIAPQVPALPEPAQPVPDAPPPPVAAPSPVPAQAGPLHWLGLLIQFLTRRKN